MAEIIEFTEQELQFICGVCFGLPFREIAKQREISEEIVMTTITGVYRKAGLLHRMDLYRFVGAALNGELQRRQT